MTPLIVGILAAGGVGGVVLVNRARARRKAGTITSGTEAPGVTPAPVTSGTPALDFAPPPRAKTPAELAAEAEAQKVAEARRLVQAGGFTLGDWIAAGSPTPREILMTRLNAAQAEEFIAAAARRGIDLLANLPLIGTALGYAQTFGVGDPRHLLDEAIKAAQARGVQIKSTMGELSGYPGAPSVQDLVRAGAVIDIERLERERRASLAEMRRANQAQRDATAAATKTPVTPDSNSLTRRQRYLAEMEAAAKALPPAPVTPEQQEVIRRMHAAQAENTRLRLEAEAAAATRAAEQARVEATRVATETELARIRMEAGTTGTSVLEMYRPDKGGWVLYDPITGTFL